MSGYHCPTCGFFGSVGTACECERKRLAALVDSIKAEPGKYVNCPICGSSCVPLYDSTTEGDMARVWRNSCPNCYADIRVGEYGGDGR